MFPIKNKKKVVIIVLAITSVVLVSLFLLQPKQTTQPQNIPQNLSITKTTPPNGVLFAAGTRDPIFIYTSKEVDPSTVTVISQPNLEFDIKVRYDDPLRMIIQPRSPWSTNTTYQITLEKGAISKDTTQILNNNVTTTIQIETAPELGGGDPR